ncbi:MAG: YitT family protein [Bacteroidales bacterium]|nr:YitT family protein [Bacteroidales bacterium]
MKKILVTIKEYALITLGILLFVLGWSIFLLPNNLIGGGVTGISSIIQYATGGAVKAGTTYFVINIALVIAALVILGRNFGGKTVYAIVIASVGLNLFQGIIPENIIRQLALDNGKLMSTIIGGLMVGVGIGVTMSQGGSTGGTDIIALIINKYRNVSPGRMLLAMDVVIILSSMIFPSYTSSGELMNWADKFITVVYAFVLVAISSTVLDFYLSGSRQSVQLFILSGKYQEIADCINNDLHRGVTILNGKGWYTKQDTNVIMVLTRKTDLTALLKLVKAIDANAFISVSSVTGVYGKGFETFKTGKKNK